MKKLVCWTLLSAVLVVAWACGPSETGPEPSDAADASGQDPTGGADGGSEDAGQASDAGESADAGQKGDGGGACDGKSGNPAKGTATFNIKGKQYTGGFTFGSMNPDAVDANGNVILQGHMTLSFDVCFEYTVAGSPATGRFGVSLSAQNDPGTYDLTTKLKYEVPSATASVPVSPETSGKTENYVAGYLNLYKCDPCGSGTITVAAVDVASGTASGSFDFTGVFADSSAKTDPTKTERVTGTFTANIKAN